MASVKSVTPNAWAKQRDTTEDMTSAAVVEGRKAADTLNERVHSTERKILEVAAYMKNITVDLAGNGIDATMSGSANACGYKTDITDQGIDASKFGTASAFDYTKDFTGEGIDATKICTGSAWDHTKTKDITDHSFVAGGEAVDKMNSCVDFAGRKIKNAAVSMRNATNDLSGMAIDSTKSVKVTEWDHTKAIIDQGMDATVDLTGEDSDATKSREATEFDNTEHITDQGKVATIDLTGEDTDSTESGSDTVFDHTKDIIDQGMDGPASLWDQTRDIAGDVSNSVYNTGSDICDAVKHGAEASWNKVTGDK